MVQLGKRYRCEDCGTEMLCTKPGDGNPVCCEKEMQLQQPNPQKSSDQLPTITLMRCKPTPSDRLNPKDPWDLPVLLKASIRNYSHVYWD